MRLGCIIKVSACSLVDSNEIDLIFIICFRNPPSADAHLGELSPEYLSGDCKPCVMSMSAKDLKASVACAIRHSSIALPFRDASRSVDYTAVTVSETNMV